MVVSVVGWSQLTNLIAITTHTFDQEPMFAAGEAQEICHKKENKWVCYSRVSASQLVVLLLRLQPYLLGSIPETLLYSMGELSEFRTSSAISKWDGCTVLCIIHQKQNHIRMCVCLGHEPLSNSAISWLKFTWNTSQDCRDSLTYTDILE